MYTTIHTHFTVYTSTHTRANVFNAHTHGLNAHMHALNARACAQADIHGEVIFMHKNQHCNGWTTY